MCMYQGRFNLRCVIILYEYIIRVDTYNRMDSIVPQEIYFILPNSIL